MIPKILIQTQLGQTPSGLSGNMGKKYGREISYQMIATQKSGYYIPYTGGYGEGKATLITKLPEHFCTRLKASMPSSL